MLDTLEPAEPEHPPAPKFIDAAKALRQRIERADLYHSATTNVLLEPAMERFRRYPSRKLRQGHARHNRPRVAAHELGVPTQPEIGVEQGSADYPRDQAASRQPAPSR